MHARLFQERECVCERAHLATTSHPGQVTAGLICRLHFTSFITRHGKGSYYLQQSGGSNLYLHVHPTLSLHPNPTLSPATSPLFHVPLYSPSLSLSSWRCADSFTAPQVASHRLHDTSVCCNNVWSFICLYVCLVCKACCLV